MKKEKYIVENLTTFLYSSYRGGKTSELKYAKKFKTEQEAEEWMKKYCLEYRNKEGHSLLGSFKNILKWHGDDIVTEVERGWKTVRLVVI